MSNYTPKQQIIFLAGYIERAHNRDCASQTETELKEYHKISAQLKEIIDCTENDSEKLKQAIAAIKLHIATIETAGDSSALIEFYKSDSFYRIVYHNSVVKGQDDNGILGELLKNGFIGIGLSALAVILFVLTSVFTAPAWLAVISTGLFAGATAFIGATVYSVINDLFATRFNLPYFLLGHQPQQRSLLRTNDPVAQGVAWGVAASFGPALIAAIGFALVTTVTACFVPVATFLFPLILISLPFVAIGAETYAHKKAAEHNRSFSRCPGSNIYQTNGIDQMCPTSLEQARWYANSDRNMFGFTKVPLIGLGALAATVLFSAGSGLLPAVLMSATFTLVLPVGALAISCAGLMGAGIYTYVNRNKQIDNRFKLEFEKDVSQTSELYLEQDQDLFNTVTIEHLNNIKLDSQQQNTTKVSSPSGQSDYGDRTNHSFGGPLDNGVTTIKGFKADVTSDSSLTTTTP